MKISPRIYLALDSCFAIKRWVRPAEWMRIAKEVGFSYVQASTDNEIDPLFSTKDYMDTWFDEAAFAQTETGVKIANFYTGYQTYRTMGLCHHDAGMVEHIKQDWIFELIRRASVLGAKGMGFCWWAVPEKAMQDPPAYKECEEQVIAAMQDTAAYAYDNNRFQVSFEQMYVPYQPPFTIHQSKHYLHRIYEAQKRPMYVTLDTGHMIGQAKYQKPTRARVLESFKNDFPGLWLGSDKAYDAWHRHKRGGSYESGADAVMTCMEGYDHMFAQPQDADEYAWFAQLARYSPIVHMQQTDGVKAGHAPFTPETLETGIITGERLLKTIAESYAQEDEIQPPVEDIYLSFELFFSNMDTTQTIMRQLRQTLEYWRRFVPEDGMRLHEIQAGLRQ